MRPFNLGFALILGSVSACSPAPSERVLSYEEQEVKNQIHSCIGLLIEAGEKWYDTNAVDICTRQNPTRPEIARRDVMAALEKRGLIPRNTYAPHAISDANCRAIAEKYIDSETTAFKQNESRAKDETLAQSAKLMAIVVSGSCKIPNKPKTL